MDIVSIKERLHWYITTADSEKIKALYTILKNDLDSEISLWDNPQFIQELESRAQEFEQGNVVLSSWEEIRKELE